MSTDRDDYQAALRRAEDSPALPEQVTGVPDETAAAWDYLRDVVDRTEARAGETVMDLIREAGRKGAADIYGPWID